MAKKINGHIALPVLMLILFAVGLITVLLWDDSAGDGLRVVDVEWTTEKLSFFWPDGMDEADRIDIRRGDGYKMVIDDPSRVQAWLDEVGGIEVSKDPEPEQRSGWLYSLSVFAGEERILALSPASVDGNVFVANDEWVDAMHRLWEEAERIKQEREAVRAPSAEWPEEWLTHESRRFGFAVDYPAAWPALKYGEDVFAGEDAQGLFEALPDAGIRLQVAGREADWLDIFGQEGTFSDMHHDDDVVHSEKLETESGLAGTFVVFDSDDDVRLFYYINDNQIVHGRFLGAMAKMDKERYEEQKKVVRHILASLRLVE